MFSCFDVHIKASCYSPNTHTTRRRMSDTERQAKSARLSQAVIVVIGALEPNDPETYYSVVPVTATFEALWERLYTHTKALRDSKQTMKQYYRDEPYELWAANDIHLYSCDLQCEAGDFAQVFADKKDTETLRLQQAMRQYLKDATAQLSFSVADTMEALQPAKARDVKWLYVRISEE